jgi:lipopolysaccharide/colanic/teichoic acid biosynthesis glycosyltransferase
MKDQKVMHSLRTFYSKYGKRWFDLALTLPGVIVISPVLIIIALLVRMRMGSPVLFRQQRPGMNGELFSIYKFRTMTDERYDNGTLLPNELRLTRFGNFLRKASLDEFPELWNVLKGEMSLVGPRPLRVEYLPLYSPEQRRRHDIKPGITGWAQVQGRNAISWDEKFKLDVWYVDNVSFWMDVKILLMTFIKVFKREGVNQSENCTMEPFKGAKLDG